MLDTEVVEELEGGKILLFLRRGIYQVRIYKGDKKYIYKSLKTKNVEEARRSAIKYYYEFEFRKAEDLPIQKITFKQVIKEYVDMRQKDYDRNQTTARNSAYKDTTSKYMLYQIKRVSKFWIEFAGNLSIEKIDNSKLKEYIGWRKDYYHKMKVEDRPKGHKINPADKTLLWEETLARTIIKFATEKGYRGKAPLPTYRSKVENKIVRPAFTVTEYWEVIRAMRRRIKEAFNDPERRYTRELLRDYVLILANSGMRVGEANNLKERDVEEFKDEHGNKNYMFNVKGKTGKRVVIPSTNTVRYIERVFERNKIRKDLLAEGTVRKVRSPQRKEDNIADWFFCMYDGNKIITLIDQFRDLLKSIGLEKNRYGETFSLYSLRHFYAMKMIRKNTVGIFDLARNMGTSVEIIEGYYGKGATSLFLATRLGGGGKKKEVESDKAKTEEQ